MSSTGGRPSVINDNTVAKLIEAFQLGCNDREACSVALINRSTYYRHLHTDEGFATEIERAKNYLFLKASSVLSEQILNGNTKISMWWIIHRDPDRFNKQMQAKTSRTNIFQHTRI